jgi:hypothetical protein
MVVYRMLLSSIIQIILIECFFFPVMSLAGPMTGLIKYEYYTVESNFTNIVMQTVRNGMISTSGSRSFVDRAQAFVFIDINEQYDACQTPVNNATHQNSIAIIRRGGDCTFSIKITRAKGLGALGML